MEQSIKETYHLIESDEIINTMKQNSVSDDFRKQRIHEIVEDSLLHEKEIQIEKLSQINAYLKTEIRKSEDEKAKIKQVYAEETTKFQKTINEFEALIENEARTKNQYKQEFENLSDKISQYTRQQEEALQEKENQLYEST